MPRLLDDRLHARLIRVRTDHIAVAVAGEQTTAADLQALVLENVFVQVIVDRRNRIVCETIIVALLLGLVGVHLEADDGHRGDIAGLDPITGSEGDDDRAMVSAIGRIRVIAGGIIDRQGASGRLAGGVGQGIIFGMSCATTLPVMGPEWKSYPPLLLGVLSMNTGRNSNPWAASGMKSITLMDTVAALLVAAY